MKWDLEIAKKRRGIPTEVENLMSDLLEKQKEHGLSRDTDEPQQMDEDEPLQSSYCLFPSLTDLVADVAQILWVC